MVEWGILNDSSTSESEAELEFHDMSSDMENHYETGDRAAILISRSRLLLYNGTKDVTVLEDFLYRLQNYADACLMKDPARIHLATTLFEGNALSWYRLHARSWESYSGYDEFVADLRDHFLPKNYREKAELELIKLKQTGSVEDYIAKFSLLANRVGNRMLTPTYINIFVGGLNGKLQTNLLGYVDRFETLTDATYMAARVSDSMKIGRYALTSQSSLYGSSGASGNTGNADYQRMDLDLVKVRKYPYGLDKATYDYLRKNNGCFYCKELGHRANQCQLKKKADTPKN